MSKIRSRFRQSFVLIASTCGLAAGCFGGSSNSSSDVSDDTGGAVQDLSADLPTVLADLSRTDSQADDGSDVPLSVLPAGCDAIALSTAFPQSFEGTTVGGSVELGAECQTTDSAPERVHYWTAPSAGTYRFDTGGSSFDTVLSVYSGCDPSASALQCNDDATNSLTSAVTVSLDAGEGVLLVVDGFGQESGTYTLSISGREEDCSNSADDDLDGAYDCDDSDCAVRCTDREQWPEAWRQAEIEMLNLVNQNRRAGANCGGDEYGPTVDLELDTVISQASRGHSADMGERGYFEHDTPDGVTFDERMTAVGFHGASPWGENIAAGSSTAAGAMQGLMNSPGHCRNIMDPSYRVMGVGYAVVEGSEYRHYWTQNFAGSH
ncbi:MAG: CAP domain-containing protein [Myxococcales bacterium]|nr:CAP domain-containing protein [Myxococcales bacterium]